LEQSLTAADFQQVGVSKSERARLTDTYFELRGSERKKMTGAYFDKYNLMVSVVQQLQAQVRDLSQQVGTAKGRRYRDVILEKRLTKMKVGELREECLARGFNASGTAPELRLRIGLEIAGRRCKCETVAVCGLSTAVTAENTDAGADTGATVETDTADAVQVGRLTATLVDREQHSWEMQQGVSHLAVKHAAEHSATLGNSCGFLLYGGAGLNSYIGLSGLRMRTSDFDFIVVSESSEHFVGQVENLLTCVNKGLDRPVCELKWPSELEGLAALVVGRRRLVDMKMMETCRFQQICVKYGQPPRAPSAQERLHGCAVAPSAYLESLLVIDPEWPGWRLEKTREQLGVVQLAKRLGVWATAGSDNPDDLFC
jgi:hypothetical protein